MWSSFFLISKTNIYEVVFALLSNKNFTINFIIFLINKSQEQKFKV